MTDINEISETSPVLNENSGSKSISRDLCCLYIAGPDDLVAMPSKPVAEAVARNFNAVWDRYGAERGHDVQAVAHVEPWMHGKEAHTKDMREHFYEYADLVLDEDAARFNPARPMEAADVGTWNEEHAERIRPSFEEWAKSKNFYMSCALPSISSNGYSDRATDWAFRAWAFATLTQPRPVSVPAAIVNLNECRARGWEDGALAYRSGWNDCRRAALGEEPLGYAGCHELATSVGIKS